MSTEHFDHIKNKTYEIYELISTAYHEAGHVIYGLLKGLRIYDVELIYDPESTTTPISGYTYFSPTNFDSFRDAELRDYFVLSQVCFHYAGLISERLLLKTISGSDHFPRVFKNGSSSDTMESAKLIRRYSLSSVKDRPKFKRALKKEISTLLEKFWIDVLTISHLLISNKKLSFIEIQNTLLLSKNKVFWKKQFKLIESLEENKEELDEDELKTLLNIH